MIEKHYTQGDLFDKIVFLLQQSGVDTSHLTRKDIAAVDEFHIGGQEMTRELARRANLQRGMRVIDIGCGLGGPCRLLADEFGCISTGIDITAEYIDIAKRLSQMTGLEHVTRFVRGSATDLPFADQSFDIAWTQHVQMNIVDKRKLYVETARVLVPHGRLVYYDILSSNHQPVYFPVPWASNANTSFLITREELKAFLTDAGFSQTDTTNETGKCIAFLKKLIWRIKEAKLLLGVHVLMGDNAIEKLENLLRNLIEKKIVVESGIAIKKADFD